MEAPRYVTVLSHDEQVLKMRVLAAQLRDHAADTSVELFKQKFEAAATELEHAALDIESQVFQFVRLPGKGSGHEYGR